MIVLDEQLLGRNLELDLSRWYRGAVRFVNDLRPNTIIKYDGQNRDLVSITVSSMM